MIQFQAINFVVTETRIFHWLPTLREEHGLRVFQGKVPRRMCGLKGREVIGGRGKLCKEELQNLKEIEMGGACSKNRNVINKYKII
jgi:hypothetical protein